MNTPMPDSLGELKISPGETVRVNIGGRTLFVYEPVGPEDDGPPFESAPPFPDPPGGFIVKAVLGSPDLPDPIHPDAELAPSDLPADDS